jgi:hypothetical protein
MHVLESIGDVASEATRKAGFNIADMALRQSLLGPLKDDDRVLLDMLDPEPVIREFEPALDIEHYATNPSIVAVNRSTSTYRPSPPARQLNETNSRDYHNDKRRQQVGNKLAALFLAGSALAHTGLTGASVAPEQVRPSASSDIAATEYTGPSEADYNAIDFELDNPTQLPYYELLKLPNYVDAPHDSYAKYLGATIFQDAFNKVLSSSETRQASPEQKFKIIQDLAKKYYDIDLSLNQKSDVFAGVPNSPKDNEGRAEIGAVTAAEIDEQYLMDLGNYISTIPKEIYDASDFNKQLVLYKLTAGTVGSNPAGFVNPDGSIYLDIYNPWALSHELTHQINRRLGMGKFYAADPKMQELNGGDRYAPMQDRAAQDILSDEKLFQSGGLDKEVAAIANVSDKGDSKFTYEESECIALRKHPDLAEKLVFTSEYGRKANSEEDKAVMGGALMSGNANGGSYLSPCKPTLRAKMREMLARYHSIAPTATEYLINRLNIEQLRIMPFNLTPAYRNHKAATVTTQLIGSIHDSDIYQE